jgi:hypothetical protein
LTSGYHHIDLWHLGNAPAIAGQPLMAVALALLRGGAGELAEKELVTALLKIAPRDLIAAAIAKWPVLQSSYEQVLHLLDEAARRSHPPFIPKSATD